MAWGKRSILFGALIVIALILDALIVRYLLAQPLTFLSAISLCIAIIAALTLLVMCASGPVFKRAQGFGDTAQGLAAISAIVAFGVAAHIYFLERKDRPRIEFDITATRAVLAQRSGRPSVLVGIRVLVTNNGNRQIELKCVTLDMFRPRIGAALTRNPGAAEEMMLEPFPDQIPFPRRFDTQCLRSEEDRKRLPRNSVRPLYAWAPLTLEPSEPDDGYFEMPVSCEYPFIRVLVKIRMTPDAQLGYETKAIIPLREICEGHAEGMATSVTAKGQPGAEAGAQAAPAEQVAPPAVED